MNIRPDIMARLHAVKNRSAKRFDKVWIVMRQDVAPEIRIDLGGGDIGTDSVQGVYLTQDAASLAKMTIYDEEHLRIMKDFEYTFTEAVEYMEDYIRFRVEEHKVCEEYKITLHKR